jgi:ABC-type bacteriocin/lantibiotic exporter with double-glycine peptidase domain
VIRWPWSRRVELVRDADDSTAALTMMLRYHRRTVTADEVAATLDATRNDEDRPNAVHIVEAAARYGMSVRGVFVDDWRQISDLPMPCICHLSRTLHAFPRPQSARDHTSFAVLDRVSSLRWSLFDPELGESRHELADVALALTGVFLVFSSVTIPPARLVR